MGRLAWSELIVIMNILSIILVASLLVYHPTTAQFSMSNIMSVLTGRAVKEAKQEVPQVKEVQRERRVQVHEEPKSILEEEEENETSLLETLNLSYAGNMDFSRALNQARNIGTSVVAAVGNIVDLKLVHNVVSVALDKLTEADRRGRAGNEEKMKEQEELKNGITTVVGAALGEQECWEKTACKAGEYAASLPGKDVLFIVLDRLVPSSWVETLDSVKQSATYEQNCNRYECSADPEGTETDA